MEFNTILLATKNNDKVKELKTILKDSNFKFITLKDLDDKYEVEENLKTYKGNSIIKAKYYFFKYKIPTIADDSGLEVKALNNEPGINSHRYTDKGYAGNNLLILEKLKTFKNRKARFITVMTLYDHNGFKCFTGKASGSISKDISGDSGFGYDCIFIPNGFDKTFSKLGKEYKNKYSARAKACMKLSKYLKKYKYIPNYEKLIVQYIKDVTKLRKVKVEFRLLGGMSNYTYVCSVNNHTT